LSKAKKKMNKFKKIFGIATLGAILMPMMGLAAVDSNLEPPVVTITIDNVFEILTTVANWLFGGIILLAVIFILIAAINYLTASGNQTKISKAHTMIMYALIGVAVAILAKGLIYFACWIAVGNSGYNCSFF